MHKNGNREMGKNAVSLVMARTGAQMNVEERVGHVASGQGQCQTYEYVKTHQYLLSAGNS